MMMLIDRRSSSSGQTLQVPAVRFKVVNNLLYLLYGGTQQPQSERAEYTWNSSYLGAKGAKLMQHLLSWSTCSGDAAAPCAPAELLYTCPEKAAAALAALHLFRRGSCSMMLFFPTLCIHTVVYMNSVNCCEFCKVL